MVRILNREAVILGLLWVGPHCGYELDKLIEEQGMRHWTDIGFSSIYYVLKRLENMNLVKSRIEGVEGKPSRRVYVITAEGKKAMKEKVKALLSNYDRPIYSFDLGVYSIPILKPADVPECLRLYLKSIDERLNLLERLLRERKKSGASYIMVVLFTRPMELLKTEKAWVEQFIKDTEEKQGK